MDYATKATKLFLAETDAERAEMIDSMTDLQRDKTLMFCVKLIRQAGIKLDPAQMNVEPDGTFV